METTFRNVELKYGKLLTEIKKLVEDRSIIEKFGISPRYYDEPLIYQYFAKISDTTKKSDADMNAGYGGGASFLKQKAIIKAACESVERYCLGVYRVKGLLQKSAQSLNNKALPLEEIISVSKKQLRSNFFADFRWNKKTKFYWLEGRALFNKKKVLMPAQLVFVPYNFRKEKIIRLPISTGAATGTSLRDAILRGILEIVERDAFMIHYLNRTFGQLIDISMSTYLSQIKEYFKKYRLELYLVNLPTDLEIYTFLALIVDKTGVGPAVSAGLKSGLDPLETAIGATEESWHSRPWIRDDLNKNHDLKEIVGDPKFLRDIKKRGLFWAQMIMVEYIKPWINNTRTVKFSKLKNLSGKERSIDFKFVLSNLKRGGHNVYYVDITRPEVKGYGFVVVKVIIPSLQPLYLDEPYPYLGGSRLYEILVKLGYRDIPLRETQLNRVPHFFL